MPERRTFSKRCLKKDCDLPIVVCHTILPDGKVCGLNGHPDIYKHGEDHLIPVVEHSHFHVNADMARNCFHSLGVNSIFLAPESMKVWTWRTPRPKERWLNIPKEVKQAMGWDDNE